MEFIELKSHLKARQPYPCYMCGGDDDFLIDRALALLSALASEPLPFNLVDKEFAAPRDLTDELMQYPMFGEHRVVIARGKADTAAIEKYLDAPNPTSVLVLPQYTPHDSWGRPSKPTVPRGATFVDCNRLPIKHVIPFVTATCARTKCRISERAIQTLYSRCAGYMTRINCEAQKLSVLREGGEVTEADVTENVIADTEFVVFELCDSILGFDGARALAVVDGMAKNNDLVAAFTLVYNRFRKIFAAALDPDGLILLGVKPNMVGRLKTEGNKFGKLRLKNILDMLEKADYAYKTGAMTVYDALTSFVAQSSCR